MAAVVGYTGGNLLSTAAASADSINSNASSEKPDSEKNEQHRHRHGLGPMGEEKGEHKHKDDMNEKSLTGETADKVKAAALAAQPGSTVMRVESDDDGTKYEAHIKKSDGTRLILKFDENFKVTSTETPPPRHHRNQQP